MKKFTAAKTSETRMVYVFYFALFLSALLTLSLQAQEIKKDNMTVYITYNDTTPQSGSLKEHESSFIENAESIVLSGRYLSELPAYIIENEQLEDLCIISEGLSAIGPGIRKLYNLKKLDLSHTYVQSLPEEIRWLKQLKEIRLPHSVWAFRLDELRKFTNAEIILE